MLNLQLFGLAAAPAAPAGGGLTTIIMLVAMFAVMYFLIIRPQKKKDKEIKAMRSSLSVGDDVVTIGGIAGKIVKISEDTVVIELSHAKQRITIAKWAVGTVEKKSKVSDDVKTETKEIETDNKDDKK